MDKSKRVLLINSDWRDIFREYPHELKEKLQRDRLGPERNDFFMFSWAKTSYSLTRDNFQTIHQKTFLNFFRPALDVFSYFYILSQIRKTDFKPNVVVTYDFGFLPTAKKIAKHYNCKVVMAINNMPKTYSATRRFGIIKSLYSRVVETLFKKIPDKYFTINDAMVTYLTDMGIAREKIAVFAMDTINRDMAFLQASTKGKIRAKYGLKDQEKILVCVARLEAEKGHERLLNLFSKLPSNFTLFLLGEGSFRPKLEAQCLALGITDRVKMPGFVRRNEIWDYYNDADAFVLLSDVEALGVVFWEAMYMRVPCLGSTAPGIVESMGEHGERGFVLTDGALPEEFVAKINACITSSESIDHMLDAAKQYVVEKISNNLTLNDII
jgi:glycosyltransferase involved in cell wall biosynthesis